MMSHEGKALMDGISVLPKEETEGPLISPAMCGHRAKTVVNEPGSSVSPDTESVGALFLDFPPATTMKNKCLAWQEWLSD